jgi:hypothetical protein
LNLTTNVDAGGTADQFSIEILDPSGNFLSPSDPLAGNLLAINLDSANPVPTSYSKLVTVTPARVVPTPEPPTGVFVGTALLALTFFLRKRRAYPDSFSG